MSRRISLLLMALGLAVLVWAGWPQSPEACIGAPGSGLTIAAHVDEPVPPQPTAAVDSAPRGTSWVVLRVSADTSELVTTVHKDALPYAQGPPVADAGAVRFRLVEADGAEVTGPCSWPRLCPCDAKASHTRGCVRVPHSGSVRVRLPRIQGPSQVLIERRTSAGWSSLASLEVDA